MTSTLSTRESASRGLPAPRSASEPRTWSTLPTARLVMTEPVAAPAARSPREHRSWSTPPAPRLSPLMLVPRDAAQAPAEAPVAGDGRAGASPAPVAPPQERRKAGAVDHVLTVLAVLGLVMMGITITATYTGLRPLVVRSGSMEPVIRTGGLVLVRTIPAQDIRVGDVVAVDRPDGVRVTHRVLTTRPAAGGRVSLELKGDANEDPDPFPVVVDEAGRLVYSAPWLGRLSAELTSARGGFALGSVITGVIFSVASGRRRSG